MRDMRSGSSPVLDDSWREAIADEFDDRRLTDLMRFVQVESESGKTIYPAPDQVFAALNRTKLADVRAVILGQDPYIRPGQAHGFAFSVPHGIAKPPSLRNVLTELSLEFGYKMPTHGCLEPWADQGVLLLNKVLTVEAGKSGSHAKCGWEAFTDRVIRAVNDRPGHVAFLLWGAAAAKAAPAIDTARHLAHVSAHPSPLARGKFFGSKPFSAANAFLQGKQMGTIDWRLGV
jgi:uracil-DNA glycosylase